MTEDIFVPIPQAQVTYQNFDKTASKFFFDVIPDTGADICLLPMSECQAIRLFYSPCITYRLRGIGAPATANLLFQGYEVRLPNITKNFKRVKRLSAVGASRGIVFRLL